VSEQILIVGTGAQAKYAAEIFALQARKILGFLSLPEENCREPQIASRILGTWDRFEQVYQDGAHPSIIVAYSRNQRKQELVRALDHHRPVFANAIHPAATIATTARLGHGVIVNAQAVIQPFATVGNHAMIHAGAIIEHDCLLEDFVNIAPRATLTGHVKVRQGATVYAGAVVCPSVEIGRYCVVGAGAVVTRSIADHCQAIGVPARVVKRLPVV